MSKLVVLSLLLAACGSGPQPVQVPPSNPAVAVGTCVEVPLESQWSGRSPVPASDVSAQCTDSKVCVASLSAKHAALVFVRGLGAGSSAVEIDFRDPVTEHRTHKTIRVTFAGDADAGAAPNEGCESAP